VGHLQVGSNFSGAAIQDVWGVGGGLKVRSQPEDGPHIGPKHVVVFLLYYTVKYSCVRLKV